MELSWQNIATDPAAQAVGIERSAKSALRWVSTMGHDWLIVFDNASDGVVRYMPAGNRGNILFASRKPHLAGLVSAVDRVEVNDMEEEDVISLLLRSSGMNESSTPARQTGRPIVKELYCLPLAVNQAGAAIALGLCGIEDYLHLYRQHRQELLADPTFISASGYGRAVYGTFDLSSATIRGMESRAAECALLILQIFAFLHHENITEEIIKRAAEASATRLPHQLLRLLPLDQNGNWDPFFFPGGIHLLGSFAH